MEGEVSHATTRRSFLKAAGAGVLAAAASAGALGALNPRIAEASDGLPATKAGVTDFGDTAGMYQEVSGPHAHHSRARRGNGHRPPGRRRVRDAQHAESRDRARRRPTCWWRAPAWGLCAAVSASDDGATQVLSLEKMSEGRGMFEGMGVVGGKKMAEAGNNIDEAEAMDAMRDATYYRVPVDHQAVGDRSGEAADWLQQFDEGDEQIQDVFKQGDPDRIFPSVRFRDHVPRSTVVRQDHQQRGRRGIFIVKDLANTFSKRPNADARYRDAVVKLERDEFPPRDGSHLQGRDGYYRVDALQGRRAGHQQPRRRSRRC